MVLQATPTEHWTFLTTRDSKPFSPAGFTNWFREICNEAALPRGLSRHGLQKAPRRSRVLRQRHRGYQRACLLAWSAAIPAAAELARMARSAIDSRPLVPNAENIEWQTRVIGLPNSTLSC